LEIGYDVPQVRIAIILASTSNMNQAAQRVGRILRKSEGKHSALIYTVYLSDTHDYTHLGVVRQATRLDGKNPEIHQGVQSSSKTVATPANTKLDFFIT
jgi:superfamily II DNA or RNA helicase